MQFFNYEISMIFEISLVAPLLVMVVTSLVMVVASLVVVTASLVIMMVATSLGMVSNLSVRQLSRVYINQIQNIVFLA